MIKEIIITATFTAGAALATAAGASADNTSYGSWGNDTLGGSLGPNGLTSNAAGSTFKVDGIGTLDGSSSLSTPVGGYTYRGRYNAEGSSNTVTVTAPGVNVATYGSVGYGREILGRSTATIGDRVIQTECRNFVCTQTR
jgi:hypothetical protein